MRYSAWSSSVARVLSSYAELTVWNFTAVPNWGARLLSNRASNALRLKDWSVLSVTPESSDWGFRTME